MSKCQVMIKRDYSRPGFCERQNVKPTQLPGVAKKIKLCFLHRSLLADGKVPKLELAGAR